MKKLFAYILASGLSCAMNAQTISIPDANFKNRLLENGLIDLDGDGEIQLEEALYIQYLDLSNANIQSLEGIQQFINLRELNCENNQIDQLPLTTLGYLKRLNCNNNNISSLDFDTSTLQELRCAHNQISAVNVGTGTLELDLSYNQITQLNLPATANYAYLNISGNLYSTLQIQQLRLENFYCEDTQLTALDLSQTLQLGETISIRNNPNLQSLNIKNNRFDFCDVMGGGCHFYLALTGNPSLTNVCLDTFEHDGVSGLNELDFFQTQYNLVNVSFNENCGGSPSPELTINDLTKNIQWYPNPVQNILNIESKNNASLFSVQVYNLMGQKVLVQNLNMSDKSTIDFSSLNTGTYLLEIVSEQGTTTSKIIKL
ncbi:T9SS type A sorting domain-containing protein [Flavobacterium sp. CYK-55]|uniref:T9SS type A sorting domain-containing protein n=1 Tax=Flavobacterium sp. CYK-55 TaxID=2835529 RepID=UPI001BD18A2E|nr:T9SS type A sorting domain-containing protein [Flavobacterium sp. CYK-55]MBS7787709.1 T9SS type A sorting domain-containing protein [Flavobacterium sp. CYK-55]